MGKDLEDKMFEELLGSLSRAGWGEASWPRSSSEEAELSSALSARRNGVELHQGRVGWWLGKGSAAEDDENETRPPWPWAQLRAAGAQNSSLPADPPPGDTPAPRSAEPRVSHPPAARAPGRAAAALWAASRERLESRICWYWVHTLGLSCL